MYPLFFFISASVAHRDLHSFPTRRSSDLAFAAAHADDFSQAAALADKAKHTAEAEITVHQEHARILNITDDDVKQFQPAPTAYAYTSHLYRAALSGSLAQMV